MASEPGAARLLERYAAVARLTVALQEALERDQIDHLDRLAEERSAELEAAEQELAELVDRGARLPDTDNAALREALAQALAEDERLSALLASRAAELPQQLAELRAARAGLGGYQAAAVESSDLVDRRG